ATSSGAMPSRGINAGVYFAASAFAVGSPEARIASGAEMNLLSHALSRRAVTPARSGPMRSPAPIEWHAAQCLPKAYSPGANSSFGASAYERVGAAAVRQLFNHVPMVVARNRGSSTPEFRIHCPVTSLPTRRCGVWPSGLLGLGSE